MTKYSTDQINRYVKDMTPHTRQLVGTAMTVLKCDEEMVKILADERIAFSVRMYLFALIAEGFGNDDVERLSKEEDVFKVVAAAEDIRRGDKQKNEKDVESGGEICEELISRISVLLDEKLKVILQRDSQVEDLRKPEDKDTDFYTEETHNDDQKTEQHLEEIIDTAGYSFREHVSAENRQLMAEITSVRKKIEGARMLFFRRKESISEETVHVDKKNKVKLSGKERKDIENAGDAQSGAEYAVWCLRNMQNLSIKQCDVLYRAASEKKFTYQEIHSLLYAPDEKLREETDMEEQYERILYKRGQAWKLEKEIAIEVKEQNTEMKINWDS